MEMKEKDLEEIKFLNFIYQNAEMGTIGIDNIEDKIEDLKFKELIKKQREEYKHICDKCIEIFIKYGKDEQELGALPKIISYITANMKTITDHSVSNIAKIMIEGSNKGIIELTEKLNNNTADDPEIWKLAEILLQTEKHNLEDLKEYL